jgi:predicted sulfurtransferase
MRQTYAAALVVAATIALAASAQVPPVPEDRRVKTEDIDSVMAKGDVVVLDVREPKEIDELGGYEGAINIPLPQLEKRLGELPKDKTILTA